MFGFKKVPVMIKREDALPGRQEDMPITDLHYVSGNPISGHFTNGLSQAMFGFGCFWGAERKLWEQEGVFSTAVGYSAGFTPNPNYQEVCSGNTGHNEVVLVFYDENKITYIDLLACFWESHNPTQGMAQGNDVGTQYRSGVYTFNEEQKRVAEKSRDIFQNIIVDAGGGNITTEIIPATEFYYAEGYHQQYLAKNIGGYCGLGGTGLKFPVAMMMDEV